MFTPVKLYALAIPIRPPRRLVDPRAPRAGGAVSESSPNEDAGENKIALAACGQLVKTSRAPGGITNLEQQFTLQHPLERIVRIVLPLWPEKVWPIAGIHWRVLVRYESCSSTDGDVK